MPTAVEEFLRAYAPVTMAREVVKETPINGCPFKPGEMVLLSFPAANRDPAVFADADRVVIDRTENRHAAFGLGIHRCIGSNLARMEITVALQEWLAAHPGIPPRPEAAVTWSEGTVRGPRRVPVMFGYAPRAVCPPPPPVERVSPFPLGVGGPFPSPSLFPPPPPGDWHRPRSGCRRAAPRAYLEAGHGSLRCPKPQSRRPVLRRARSRWLRPSPAC